MSLVPLAPLLPGHETNPPYLCHLSVSGCHWKGTYWTPSLLSLFLPPLLLPLSLFYFFSISRFLLTLLWQSAQPQGQRTEGLACVFVMKKEAGEERGKGKYGQDGELEMRRIWQIVHMIQKWQFLCKYMEIFSGGSQNSMRPLFNKCVHIYSNFTITLNNPYIGE